MTPQLKERVRELLISSGLSDEKVAEQLNCSVQWVRLFRQNRVKGPSVNTIERLYFILTGNTLI